MVGKSEERGVAWDRGEAGKQSRWFEIVNPSLPQPSPTIQVVGDRGGGRKEGREKRRREGEEAEEEDAGEGGGEGELNRMGFSTAFYTP